MTSCCALHRSIMQFALFLAQTKLIVWVDEVDNGVRRLWGHISSDILQWSLAEGPSVLQVKLLCSVSCRLGQTLHRHRHYQQVPGTEQRQRVVLGAEGPLCQQLQTFWSVATSAVWDWSDWSLLLGGGVEWRGLHIGGVRGNAETGPHCCQLVWSEWRVMESEVRCRRRVLHLPRQDKDSGCVARQRLKPCGRVPGPSQWNFVLLLCLWRQRAPPPHLQDHLLKTSACWLWPLLATHVLCEAMLGGQGAGACQITNHWWASTSHSVNVVPICHHIHCCKLLSCHLLGEKIEALIFMQLNEKKNRIIGSTFFRPLNICLNFCFLFFNNFITLE